MCKNSRSLHPLAFVFLPHWESARHVVLLGSAMGTVENGSVAGSLWVVVCLLLCVAACDESNSLVFVIEACSAYNDRAEPFAA